MKHSFTLQYGLEYEGKTHFQAALKPLTIGGELNAMDAIDNLPALPENPSEAQQSRRAVQETLIYWAQQLSIDGIPQDIITADYLLNHLSGADYSLLVDEMETLRSKSTAATEAPAPPRSGSLNTPRSSQTAHQQYRQAVIMLARAGLGAADVRAMCHAELTAWLQDLLASMGIHSPTGGEVIVSRRLPKPSA